MSNKEEKNAGKVTASSKNWFSTDEKRETEKET
jgi:hypothetical protein